MTSESSGPGTESRVTDQLPGRRQAAGAAAAAPPPAENPPPRAAIFPRILRRGFATAFLLGLLMAPQALSLVIHTLTHGQGIRSLLGIGSSVAVLGLWVVVFGLCSAAFDAAYARHAVPLRRGWVIATAAAWGVAGGWWGACYGLLASHTLRSASVLIPGSIGLGVGAAWGYYWAARRRSFERDLFQKDPRVAELVRAAWLREANRDQRAPGGERERPGRRHALEPLVDAVLSGLIDLSPLEGFRTWRELYKKGEISATFIVVVVALFALAGLLVLAITIPTR
jgi:hypothetical protein